MLRLMILNPSCSPWVLMPWSKRVIKPKIKINRMSKWKDLHLLIIELLKLELLLLLHYLKVLLTLKVSGATSHDRTFVLLELYSYAKVSEKV